ncbi:MAG: gliding motility-associated C-terminal domain-containing protein, partial [Flavobacteriales bacterium]|nr:gliding motility-associated C-terminal domain-containing protein [Flavobacteriales bacterium]
WSMGASDPFVGVSPTTSTTYSVTVTDGCGISAMDEAAVLVNAPVAAFSYTGQVYVTDYPIQFLDQSLGAVSWSWDFAYPDLTSEEQYPVIRFPADGWFNVMLAIMDDLGCVDTTYRTLFIDPQFQFYAPSAFTPDGDGINDVFSGAGVGVETYQMRIFDRWGQLVYETNDPSEPWDGSKAGAECPTGVYVYWFRLQAIAGEVNEFMGHVTLVR